MKFTATGMFQGRRVSITWEDGEVSGDPEAVAALKQLAKDKVGEPVGISTFHRTTHHHLKSNLSTWVLLIHILDMPTFEGDKPDIPDWF
jgi:hypothetical protein